ncbi:MAG: hypothetical protein DRO39_00890 [Thermoprotei archaeon]|nr:MAG: hypothetical protein DRO39_00890 [Thermoprotei archaeon]
MEGGMEELENLIAGIEEASEESGGPSEPLAGSGGTSGRIGRVIRRIETEASRVSGSVMEVVEFLEVFCLLAPITTVPRVDTVTEHERARHAAPTHATSSTEFEMGGAEVRVPDVLRTLARTGGCGVAKC